MNEVTKSIIDQEKNATDAAVAAYGRYCGTRPSTEFVCDAECDCPDQRLISCEGNILVVCPDHEPYIIRDGIKYKVGLGEIK